MRASCAAVADKGGKQRVPLPPVLSGRAECGLAAMGFAQHAAFATCGTLLSRLLGFARDAALAWLLGAGGTADALSVALRLPYAFRKLLGEGALSLTLTVACSAGSAPALAALVTRRLLVLVAPWLLIALAAAPALAFVLAPGLDSSCCALAAQLLYLTLPYICFALLTAGFMARLHAGRHFALPGMVPAVFNLTVLLAAGGAFLFAGSAEACASWFAGGVLAGGAAQWALAGILARCCAPRPAAVRLPSPQEVRRTLAAFTPGLLSAAVPQLAFLLAAMVASVFEGGPSSLFFAERLLEFPLAISAVGINLALTPLVAALTAQDPSGSTGSDALAAAFVLPLLLTLPAAAGLAACAQTVVSLLLEYGAFDAEASGQTAQLLAVLSLSLPACAVVRPLLVINHVTGSGRKLAGRAGIALGVVLLSGYGLTVQHALFCAPAAGVCAGLWLHAFLLWLPARHRMDLRSVWPVLLCSGVGSLAAWGAASASIRYGGAAGWSLPFTLGTAVAAGVLAWGALMLPVASRVRRMVRQLNGQPEAVPCNRL